MNKLLFDINVEKIVRENPDKFKNPFTDSINKKCNCTTTSINKIDYNAGSPSYKSKTSDYTYDNSYTMIGIMAGLAAGW